MAGNFNVHVEKGYLRVDAQIPLACAGEEIDEAWLALSHEMFQRKIKEWLLVLRKKNCAVVLATQNLSDIMDSPIRQTILDSCFTRILLPNPSARNDDLKELYMGRLGFNSQQVRLIANAVMKRHYYYAAPNSRNYRLFDLGLAPVALCFAGASGKDDLKTIRELQKKHGKEWPAHWLRFRGPMPRVFSLLRRFFA